MNQQIFISWFKYYFKFNFKLKEEKVINLTGRELVFHLLEATHLGNAVSYYLNNTSEKLFRPYDLITVPQVKKNPEHYIFSVFGGLHILPDCDENEQFTLAEWNREAMIWQACSNIKFFKQFLKNKFLRRWITNAKFSRFLKLKKSVASNILHTVPEYGQALLLVSKLIQEINAIVFLPKDKVLNLFTNLQDKQLKNNNNTQRILDAYKQKQEIIKESFTLEKYSNAIYDLNRQSKEILKYFFAYVKCKFSF